MSAELVLLIMLWADLIYFCCVVVLELKGYNFTGKDSALLFGTLLFIHLGILIGWYYHS